MSAAAVATTAAGAEAGAEAEARAGDMVGNRLQSAAIGGNRRQSAGSRYLPGGATSDRHFSVPETDALRGKLSLRLTGDTPEAYIK